MKEFYEFIGYMVVQLFLIKMVLNLFFWWVGRKMERADYVSKYERFDKAIPLMAIGLVLVVSSMLYFGFKLLGCI